MYEYNCTVERVVDGDTIDVVLDLGFDILYKSRVRLYGIDTPESRTRNLDEKARGKLAGAFLKNVIDVGNFIEKEIKKLIKENPSKLKSITGKGLMLGIKCIIINTDLCEKLREKGLLVVPAANNVVRLLPPLNITIVEAKIAISKIKDVMDKI